MNRTKLLERVSTLAWLFVPMGCPDPGDLPSGDTDGHPCDTQTIQQTSGGDYSGPWAWDDPQTDTGAEKQDVGSFVERDPTRWELDSASGIYYRSPTDDEIADYGWSIDHLLVIPDQVKFVDAVLAAAATARVALPVHDNFQGRPQTGLEIATIDLTRHYSHAAIPFLETKVTSTGAIQHNAFQPTLSLYLPTGIGWSSIPDRVVAVMSSSRGGLELQGATDTERYWLRGPFEHEVDYDLEIRPPSGTGPDFFVQFTVHDQFFEQQQRGGAMGMIAPLLPSTEAPDARFASSADPTDAQTPIGTCVDNLDNDPDGYADSCDFACVVHKDFGGDTHDYEVQFEDSKDYALIGDINFCNSNKAPEAYFALIADQANSILNNLDPPPAYQPSPRSPPFRMPVCACFVWEGATQLQIEDCDSDENDCPAGLNYPLGGTGTNPDAILGQAWQSFEAGMESKPAAQVRPVHMVAIVTDRNIVSGKSGLWAVDTPAANGRLVVNENSTNQGGAGGTLAHEIGHTLGLAHDAVPYDGSALIDGFMREGHHGPVLDWDADSNITGLTQGDVWKSIADKFHPRASGFEFVGCTAPADCDTGHPGLTCNAYSECKPQ